MKKWDETSKMTALFNTLKEVDKDIVISLAESLKKKYKSPKAAGGNTGISIVQKQYIAC